MPGESTTYWGGVSSIFQTGTENNSVYFNTSGKYNLDSVICLLDSFVRYSPVSESFILLVEGFLNTDEKGIQ